METDRLMQAVLQSFLDADLRVEVVPKKYQEEKYQGRTADVGTGPSYDATTQAAGRNVNIVNYTKQPEPSRMRNYSGRTNQCDSTTQAVDGQYATVYRVQHCKMTPTSPPPMTSEFPPQRPDVAYGGDNFQVGGRGSGETCSMPLKSTSYRGGGMNWPNRSDVYSPRMSRCSDSFERSLRKYPSMPPEHSSEVFERLITYAMPRTSRSPRHSPQRETVRPKAYEEPCKYRPRAPEEDPTRDRRDDLSHLRESSKQAYAKHGDIRQIREMSRRLRKSLKTISSYSHMHTIATYLDGIDRDCDTPILETSETEHEDAQPAHEFSYPVNSTVQAAVPTTSLGVEAKPLPSSSQRTIAVPLSPTPSSRLTSGDILPVATTSLGVETKPLLIGRRTQIAIPLSPTPSSRCTGTDFANYFSASPPKTSLGVETIPSSISKRSIAVPLSPVSSKLTTLSDLPRLLITRSVQTFNFPGRSVETVTSNRHLPNCNPKLTTKKSKSLSDFRLNRDFKSEVIAWLDDNNDPTIQKIKDTVLKNLKIRLKGVPVTGDKKIKVKIGNCLKCKKSVAIEPCVKLTNKRSDNTQKQGAIQINEEEKEFKDTLNEWLNNVSIMKQNITSKTVDKEQNMNTFADKLKYLALVKSKRCSEHTMKTEILGILDDVLVDVNACDKAAFLEKFSDVLMSKLDSMLLGQTETKTRTFHISEKPNVNLHNNQITDKATKNPVVKELIEDLQTQKDPNPDLIKQTIEDLVDTLKDSVNNQFALEEIASTLHNTAKFLTGEAIQSSSPQRTEKLRKKITKRHAANFSTQPLTVFMVQNWSSNYVPKLSGTKISQHSIRSIIDRDIEYNLNRYKSQLAQQIDQWLSDLSLLKEDDTECRQVIVLDLASDIIERQKYLEFNKNRTSDIDELEHLKYLIFKWMKRYDGEKNMEIVHHAVELMEMIKNIPVPTLSRSQDVLQKSISHLSCRNTKYGPGTSTDTSKNTVYNSRSDSSIHKHNVSQVSIAPSFLVIDGVPLVNKQKNDSRRQKHKDLESRPVNQCNQPNMRYLIVKHDSDLSKDSKDNSQETLKHELLPKRTMSHIPKSLKTNEINNVHNSVSQSNSINREEHSSQDSFVSSKSQDDLHGFYSGMRCKDHNHEPGTSNNISQDGVNMSKLTTQKKHQKDSILENYVVHNVNNTNNRRYQREDITPKRNSLKSKKKFNKKQEKSNSSKMFISLDNADEEQNENYVNLNPRPDPAGLVTPVPTHSDKPSSAAAQLIAEWRPQPVFTPSPVGRPQLDQIHEEFKEYLKSWCEQIPIPDNTCDEKEIAGKSRLGILNGVWKMITKLKAQPAVFQNKFYYEDVLGKEIDGLLDCLPQTHELQEKKYSLKSQLLDKISDMNEVIKEIETPDNYKEVLANKAKIMKDKKGMFLRKTVRLDREPAEKIFEEMLKYCTLDDFLTNIDYKEPNKIIEKAYKNKLLPKIQAYMDELKEAHGKEMDELMDVYKESDILEQLETVPLPTEDEIKKDSEEILLGLEIEQWMNELPIIKSDDVNEQRQRVRLRDGLTKKIHDMGKRADISEYGEDTKVRHEISCFLDMVPLEKDQDLNINRMVDELTNRLKQRDGSGGRRKSVAFEDGTGYQQGYSSKLLNRSEYSFGPPGSGIYSPEGKLVQGDDETQYKSFAQNPPLCSTRIEQPGEWDDDAQYRAMFKDGVPCSSMIEPQAGYGPGSLPPDFKHSFPPPRQFNESALGGSFGYSRRGSEERHQYPDGMGIPMTPRSVPRSPGFHDSAAAMPKIPNDSEFVSLHGSSLQEAPRAFEQPQSVGWVPPEAPRYVSMRDSVPSQMSPRRFSNDPAFTQRSQIDPNISAAQEYMPMTRGGAQRVPQGFISMPSRRPSDIQPPSRYQSLPPNQFIPPQAFIPEESRFSRRSKASNDPSMRQELLDDSVGSSRGMTPQGPFEVSIQVHEPPRQYRQLDGADPFVSIVSQQRPNEFMDVRNRSAQNQPGIRISPARDLNEIQNISSHQQARIPVPSPHASRNTPTDRITEASQPTSSQRGRLLASNAPSSEISNQPAFYSTPNQRSNLPPPNIRERRQLEKERGPARRLDMETEEEGEERCYCRQRFNKWRGQHCQSCDDCIQGRYYPYRPYPYQYMYPPMGPPPYPPHCRR